MTIKKISSFLIAAPKSNSGKTIITLGLIKALVNKGLKVRPFKCGPDYIDPMHHREIAKCNSYNLDLWMADKQHVKQVYSEQLFNKDIAVVEGVMGLFDGAQKDRGSSAEVAMLLDIPVILVVDASSMAYSAAPLLYGFRNFDKNLKIAGVIFNKVAGQSHYTFLKEAAKDAKVIPLGYIPRNEKLGIKSRHLGLHLPNEQSNTEIIDFAAQLIEQHINLDKLLKKSMVQVKLSTNKKSLSSSLTFAIAKDEAFNFSYPANIDSLNRFGRVSYFSPLNDNKIPECDLIWLPGGYPEIFADQLSNNASMITDIKRHIKDGKALIAECGGLMYLGKSIIEENGKHNRMANVFEIETSFEQKQLHLGYREIKVDDFTIKGHEFHYSNLVNNCLPATYEVKTARGSAIEMSVFRYKNCWASYMHIYLGEEQKMKLFLKHLNVKIKE